MLNTQQKYLDFISFIKDKTKNIVAVDQGKQDELIKAIENKRLIVPVVGGFSAGKSSLINQFLGKDILSTSITPETAMATELIYADESYYEAVRSDGTSARFELDETEKIKEQAANFEFLRLFLKEEKLKQIEPLILVDMPGFEAPLKDHNKAILNYLSKGVYFIVLTSIEDGTISKSMLREIDNIMTIGKDFTFCLSKTNLRSSEQVKEVQTAMQEQLLEQFEYQKELVLTAKDSAKEFQNILTSINPEELFEKLYKDELKNHYFETESSINTQISTLKSSKADIAKILESLAEGVHELKKAKEKALANAEDRYAGKNLEDIVNAVASALMSQKTSLVSLMQNNQAGFNEEVNSIIKNVALDQISAKLKDFNEEIAQYFKQSLDKVSANLSHTELGTEFIDILEGTVSAVKSTGLDSMLLTTKDPYTKIVYTILQILDPLLKLLKQQRLHERLEAKFINEIIPSVKTKLRSTLPAVFNEHISKATEAIGSKFEEQIKAKENEVAKSAKEQELKVDDIQKELDMLSEAKKQIANYANEIF
ncbi:dynamin family protein [Campylobacter sp. MIT 12-5580]|uniref:dynamin family protein n=1 Tax=Campylobacter sp. MIT 12-5580 TaxID=2040651 RepID=UPI0014859F77|nr:dynamin family protein [Campylobacter sp. MIT 12-5580]